MGLDQIISQSIQNTKKRFISIIRVLVVIVVIFIAVAFGFPYLNNNFFANNKVSLTTTMVLEKILEVSDLSTVETSYSSIVRIDDPVDNRDTLYYISYEATISAGIDFSLVDLALDHEEKKLTITIPESKILDTNVDIGSLDYIFIDKKSNNESVTAYAYQICKNDVAIESENIPAIKELAYENALGVISALTVPFMQQLGAEYELVIA